MTDEATSIEVEENTHKVMKTAVPKHVYFLLAVAMIMTSFASTLIRLAGKNSDMLGTFAVDATVIAFWRLLFATLGMFLGALVTRNEVLLLIIGGVFVMELISVVLQVGYFRLTGGKRIFKMAPIHHHFHLKGWSEPQVVVRFWLLAAAFAALALATLKIR